MKRKSIALLLALAMCLSLLSACGGDNAQNTGEPTTSDSTPETTGQQPDEKDEQPSQEPEQTEPEESEEPTQEPTKEPAGPTAAILALLQDEYENGGTLWGHSANHVCVNLYSMYAFADGEDIFVKKTPQSEQWYWYNTATKEVSEPLAIGEPDMYIDGLFYSYDTNEKKIFAYDKTGALIYSTEPLADRYGESTPHYALLEKGFVACETILGEDMIAYLQYTTYSYDLKERRIIPMPEMDVGHGIKEPVTDFEEIFSVDGGAYGIASKYDGGSFIYTVYKLNTDIWAWEEFDTVDDDGFYRLSGRNSVYEAFYGRYVYSKQGVFDILTGEQVFTFDKQYPMPHSKTVQNYIADRGVYIIRTNILQLVDLHSSGVSEKWAMSKKYNTMSIIDETYLVYWDEYGCFLWNALDGTEETIMLNQ